MLKYVRVWVLPPFSGTLNSPCSVLHIQSNLSLSLINSTLVSLYIVRGIKMFHRTRVQYKHFHISLMKQVCYYSRIQLNKRAAHTCFTPPAYARSLRGCWTTLWPAGEVSELLVIMMSVWIGVQTCHTVDECMMLFCYI